MRSKPNLVILAIAAITTFTVLPAAADAASSHVKPHRCNVSQGSESYREEQPTTTTREGMTYQLQVTIAEDVSTTWEYPSHRPCRYKGRHSWVHTREVVRTEVLTPPYANLATVIIHKTTNTYQVTGQHLSEGRAESLTHEEEVPTPTCGKATQIPGEPFVPCAPEALNVVPQ